MKVDWETLSYNLFLYVVALLIGLAFIQHSCYFYGPGIVNMDRWVTVPVYIYPLLGLGIFLLGKATFILLKKSYMMGRNSK